jgi:hypothetical protein
VKITGVSLKVPEGWRVEPSQKVQPGPGNVAARGIPSERAGDTRAFTLTAASDARPTQPYWLTAPRTGQLFTWPAGSPKGEPFAPALISAVVQAEIAGAPVVLTQPLEFRLIDFVRGELRRNVEVVPAVSVALDSPLQIVPLASTGLPRKITVRLQSNARVPLKGSVRLDAPSGWTVSPPELSFELQRTGEGVAAVFALTAARNTQAGTYVLKAVAMSGGRAFDLSQRTVAYPHIQTHRLYAPAQALLQLLDLQVAPVKVGYIMGSGDEVPEALLRMGLDVTLLDADVLAAGDLSRFDTIVAGINASAARPDFVAAN